MISRKNLIAAVILFSIIISFNAEAFKIRSTWADGQKYVYLKDVASYYGMQLTRQKKYCTLTSKYSKLVFNYNSKLSNINGVTVYLSFPVLVRKIGSYWPTLISEKDFTLLLDPILRKAALVKQEVKTIVIDPGHGGKDNGTSGKVYKEKEIVLQVAKRLSIILKKAGYRVVMTRNRDVFPSLTERPAALDKFGGDVFVSLHCNSGADKNTRGIETFIYTPEGTQSTYGGKIIGFQNGNRYNKNNAKLGYEIQKKLNIMKAIDRGVKHAQFKVLRLSTKPAVLVELGFLSSSQDEKNLATPNYQYLLAYRIAQGISAYAQAVK